MYGEIVLMMAKPKTERNQKWFCSLCGDYNIERRTAHLIKVHNVTAHALDQRSTSLFDQIFSPVVA